MKLTDAEHRKMYDLTKENNILLRSIELKGCVKGNKDFQELNRKLWLVVVAVLGSLVMPWVKAVWASLK